MLFSNNRQAVLHDFFLGRFLSDFLEITVQSSQITALANTFCVL